MNELGYRITNYDGGLPSHTTPESKGRLVLGAQGRWELHFPGGIDSPCRRIAGEVGPFTFEVADTGPSSSRVAIHHTQDPGIHAQFDVPLTPAAGLKEVLADHARALIVPEPVPTRRNSPEHVSWWEDIEPQTILSNCHYAGERDIGTLTATETGLDFTTRGGSRGHCPWSDITDIEVADSTTRIGRRSYKGNSGPVGLGLVESRDPGRRSILTITDTRGRRLHFVTDGSSHRR